MVSTRAERQQAIERQAQRLARRTVPLQTLSNRVSWVRVGIFIGGTASAFAVGTQIDEPVGWALFVATGVVFAVVVAFHRHLEHWIETFRIARELKLDQLARLGLEWEKLAPAQLAERVRESLALDLDLTGPRSLHHLLDTTVARRASELLADWLMQTHPELEPTQTRQRMVRELVPLARFRDRFRLTFRLVLQEQLEGENLVYWLGVEFPTRRLRWALPVAAALVAVNLMLFALNILAGMPPYWAISLLAYVAFYFFNQPALNTVFAAIVRLDSELDRFSAILRYLEKTSYTRCEHLGELCAPFRDPHHSPSAHIRRIKIATAGIGLRSNPVLGLALNLALPWDFFFAYLASRYRAQVAQLFPRWADVCYNVDALIALANFGYLNPEYTFPEITLAPRPILSAERLGHPLIPDLRRVHNDFVVDAPGELAIITGSNMAGKSTFIKTVGINLCLAYAGGPVTASRFDTALFRLHTCIHISDSIADGFSYFYAEVKCLKRLLDELKTADSRPLLYLIDEIFRGTNNRERLLGSRAYIRALLGANGIGLLATHDLELAALANQNYHFRDQVVDGKLVFDYRIHPGPSPTTNALKIMAMEGLPVESQ
ncbi:MAG: hypothetical protein HY782_28235 [Chloroflexi bacterium]|nr:hypothetical protein [Chloroflexota bacterium]